LRHPEQLAQLSLQQIHLLLLPEHGSIQCIDCILAVTELDFDDP
jgi:hypothetical protein